MLESVRLNGFEQLTNANKELVNHLCKLMTETTVNTEERKVERLAYKIAANSRNRFRL